MSYFVYKYPNVGGDTYEVDRMVVSLRHVMELDEAKALSAEGWYLSPTEAKAAHEAEAQKAATGKGK